MLYHQAKKYEIDASLFYSRSRWKLGRASESMKGIKPTRDVTRDRISALESGSKMNEASQMSVQMLDDPEESVRLLVFSNQWQEAIMTSATSGRPDLIETEVKPALESTAKNVLEEIKTLDSQWAERSDRIIFLREEQRNKINLLGEYDEKVIITSLHSESIHPF